MINNKHVRTLLAGADAGHYDLPPKLLKLREAAETLPYPPLREPVVPGPGDLAADAADRLLRGETVPDTVHELIAAAERDHERWSVDSRYRQALFHVAETRITDAFLGAYEDVMKALQPAHTQTVVELGKVAKVLPEGVSAEVVLTANNDKMRDAWLSLGKLSIRYGSIRAAALSLRQPEPEWDQLGEFAEFKNLKTMFPGAGRTSRGMAPINPPWIGLDPAERLLWLVHHGAEFWLPTAAERDKLWWKHYGEGVERQRANAWNAEGYKGALGGSGSAGERPTRHPRDVIAGRPYGDAA